MFGRSLTFAILAWVTLNCQCQNSFPLIEFMEDVATELGGAPESLLLNLQNDILYKIGNSTWNPEQPFSTERTSAKFTPDTEKIAEESSLNIYLYWLLTTRYRVEREAALRILRRNQSPFCQMPQIICDTTISYRSIDGTCNNLQNPEWGASFRKFDRIARAVYEDRFNEPRGGGNSGYLPNPRLISSTIHYDVISPDQSITNMVPQLGQFIDHDLSLAPEGDKHCCTSDRDERDCFPISIPINDPFYSTRSTPQTCLDFTRSSAFCFPGTTGIREQFNILTSFLDASQVYGSDAERADQLRAYQGGRLLTNAENPNMLPTVAEVEIKISQRIAFMGKYLAGDERVNEMPALTTMHILLVREHNRIADEIQQLNPDWEDDKVFEEARRILIAEWQDVVYGEYLPVILGESTVQRYQLAITDEHTMYLPSVNPTIFHAFATAAYRFGHTLINGIIQLYRGLARVGSYPLKDNFFESEQVDRDGGDGFNLILNGLTIQNAQTYDPHVTEAVTNFLLRNRTTDFGSDLIARNIQRAREHGLPSYNAYRKICKLTPLSSSWNFRPNEILSETWALLRTVYRFPRDIDLFTGGLSEVPLPNAFSGATFNCLKAMQFNRIKFGDRFFFTHANQVGSFSAAQLQNIRRRTFGDMICENSNLDMTTINVFRIPSQSNPQMFCNDPLRNKLDIPLLLQKA